MRHEYEFRQEVVKREVEFVTGTIFKDGERYAQLAHYPAKRPQQLEQALERMTGTLGIPLSEVKR